MANSDTLLNYARGMPHDGCRLLLPYLIDTYKNGIATIEKEGLVAWYRAQPAIKCSHGNTTLNTAGYFQYEFPPYMLRDEIFFSALLGSRASVTLLLVIQSFLPIGHTSQKVMLDFTTVVPVSVDIVVGSM